MIITEKHLPTPEKQRKHYTLEEQRFIFDTLGCVSESGTNCNEFIGNKKKDEFPSYDLDFLKDGFFDESNKLNFSGREIAMRSDTTKKGNSGSKVANTIVGGEVSEKIWPWPEPGQDRRVTWNEYYSPLPEKVNKQRAEYAKRFDNPWRWIKKDEFIAIFKKDKPLQGFVYAWVRDKNKFGDLYYRPEGKTSNHAIMVIGVKLDNQGNVEYWIIFDTYEPFIKKVHPNNLDHWAIEFDFIIKNKSMDIENFKKENNNRLVRNEETGAYGVIYDEEFYHITEKRAGLFVIDREARGILGEYGKVEISNDLWNRLKPKKF